MSLEAAILSHAGRRRERNEDFGASDPDRGVFVVADGMGGHKAGDTASVVGVATLTEYLDQTTDDGYPIRGETLRDAVAAANTLVLESAQDRGYGRMGCTMTALVLRHGRYLIGHVGDTRAWRVRGGKVVQLTDDHSFVAERVRRGILTPEEAAVHPKRNVVTRALGAHSEVEVDRYEGSARPGDVFVLASDGLFRAVSDDQIRTFLADSPSVGHATHRLVEYAVEHDGSDNVTVLVVRCHP